MSENSPKVQSENRALVVGDLVRAGLVKFVVDGMAEIHKGFNGRVPDTLWEDINGLLKFRSRGLETFMGSSAVHEIESASGRRTVDLLQGYEVYRGQDLINANKTNNTARKEGFGYISFIPEGEAYMRVHTALYTNDYRVRSARWVTESGATGRWMRVCSMVDAMVKSGAEKASMLSYLGRLPEGDPLKVAARKGTRQLNTIASSVELFREIRDRANLHHRPFRESLETLEPVLYNENSYAVGSMNAALDMLHGVCQKFNGV